MNHKNNPQQATVVELRWMLYMVMLTPLLMMEKEKEKFEESVRSREIFRRKISGEIGLAKLEGFSLQPRAVSCES